MTKDEVLATLPEWQKILRLQDWDLAVRFEKHCDGYGRARLSAKYKNAEIVMREPEFLDPSDLCSKDLEVTLVHELLHVQAGHLTDLLAQRENDRYYDEMERLVELTAIALVKLRRESGKRAGDGGGKCVSIESARVA